MGGEQTTGFLATWPVVKKLGHILPSTNIVQLFAELVYRAPFDPPYVRISQQTHLNYLGASLGLNFNDVTNGAIHMGSEPSKSSLLLSACLSGLHFGRSTTLVKDLLENGFTAHGQVRLVNFYEDDVRKSAVEFTTVWMILVAGLAAALKWPREFSEPWINILGEILLHESQEEVLLLGTGLFNEGCYCFYITLEDFIRHLDESAQVLDYLQDWPKYGDSDSESEHAPTWIRERWRGQSFRPIAGKMRNLSTAKHFPVMKEVAVVSRNSILEDRRDSPRGFTLW